MKPGSRIGDWVVEAPLGEGGMGSVYRCHNAMSERILAAVKVLKPHNVGQDRQRFVREVEALYNLRHDAVVRVTGWGEQDDQLWMAMELVEGHELAYRLRAGPMPEAEAVRVFRHLSDGLRHAHQQGITHRDIKPENIMITPEGSGRLLDFGIALDEGKERLTSNGSFSGTLAFVAPEQFDDSDCDPRLGDVYGLGLTLYVAITGRHPFPRDSKMSESQRMAFILRRKLEIEALDPGEGFSEEVRSLVRRATASDPKQRLQSMGEFALLLGVSHTEPTAPIRLAADLPPPADVDTTRPYSTGPLATGGIAMAAGGAGFMVALGLVAGLVLLGAGGGAWYLLGAPSTAAAQDLSTQEAEHEPVVLEPMKPVLADLRGSSQRAAAAAPAGKADEPTPRGQSRPQRATTTAVARPSQGRRGGRARSPMKSPEAPVMAAAPSKPAAAPSRPAAAPVPIAITSIPLGASVSVDGEAAGRTPLGRLLLSPGSHEILLERGSDRIQTTIHVGRRAPTRFVWKGGTTWESGF